MLELALASVDEAASSPLGLKKEVIMLPLSEAFSRSRREWGSPARVEEFAIPRGVCASSTERAGNTEVANDAVPGYVSQMALLSLPDAVLIHIAEQLVDTNLRDWVRLSSIT